MKDTSRIVIGGVDTHADTHQAAVLDERGRLLGVSAFPTTPAGYEQLLAWMRGHGTIREVGVESPGSYGAGLTRHLRAAGVTVVEVNRPHAHTRNRRGKNDAIDAEAAARKVLAGECTAIPKDTTGIVEAIRQLLLARASAVHARAAAMHQLGQLVVTAPAQVRQSLTAKTLAGKAAQAARWRPDPTRLADPAQAARTALRSIARRIHTLSDEIKLLDRQLAILVRRAAPRTLALLGVGVTHAAQMLVTAGQNIDRLRSENAFAHMCGADPIPASSGKTERHRLKPRRRPRRQPHPLPDRRHPAALLPENPHLRQPPNNRGQIQERDHPLPQTLHRPRDLLHPPRGPKESRSHPLTVYRNVPGRFSLVGAPGACSGGGRLARVREPVQQFGEQGAFPGGQQSVGLVQACLQAGGALGDAAAVDVLGAGDGADRRVP
jgi:transposase